MATLGGGKQREQRVLLRSNAHSMWLARGKCKGEHRVTIRWAEMGSGDGRRWRCKCLEPAGWG